MNVPRGSSARPDVTVPGRWPSDFSAAQAVAASADYSDLCCADGALWWLDLDPPGVWARVHTPAGAPRPDRRLGHGGVGLNSSLWLLGGLAVQGGAADAADAAALPVMGHVWRFKMASGGASGGACPHSCGAHGECDLRHARCVCDPPWSGPSCAEPSAVPAPTVVVGGLRLLIYFSAAVVGGLFLGWVHHKWESFGPGRRGYSRIGDARSM